jgi:hypothetical protein
MAVEWCRGCGELFGTDMEGSIYCTPGCKAETHQRLLPRRQPKSATLLVFQAFQALADESAKFNAFHKRMRRE